MTDLVPISTLFVGLSGFIAFVLSYIYFGLVGL